VSRITVWRWLSQRHPDGQILPAWLIVCQVVLFPRRSLLWFLSRDCGFDLYSCCWTIHGVKFSDKLFSAMAQPRQDILHRFDRDKGSSFVSVTEVRRESLARSASQAGVAQ